MSGKERKLRSLNLPNIIKRSTRIDHMLKRLVLCLKESQLNNNTNNVNWINGLQNFGPVSDASASHKDKFCILVVSDCWLLS